ncbi:MAG: DUF4932 domain-containing protein [Dysgonamonadaceae bacterium]|jgi:hypothetical protein|nr:DUF4932 domain-containing protein [Dysgonamonadaceae bacterium]
MGKQIRYEVLKVTKYYQEILDYFEPVENHPLLDSVNYSRERWEDYLSFRTDAYAFSFDENNKVKRTIDFFSVENHALFDNNLDLINDFVEKSAFRQFYDQHKDFYNYIIRNYRDYYFVDKAFQFLDNCIGKSQNLKNDLRYVIVLSPLVNRMNCHRDIDESTVADFPSATPDFLNDINNGNLISRLNGNHMLFTEMDHGYINPISDKYSQLISENFENKIWDNNSGYEGINVFNEYMTWAIYDLFICENYPEAGDSIILSWQYQNASRGFYAQNIFSEKVAELYNKKGNKNFESIYEPLLKWCKVIENKISLPTLINNDSENFVKTDLDNIQLTFSEKMNTKQPFCIQVVKYNNIDKIEHNEFIEIADFNWSNDGKTVNFKLDAETEYDRFALIFNWWGNNKPLLSANGIFLRPRSYVLLRK